VAEAALEQERAAAEAARARERRAREDAEAALERERSRAEARLAKQTEETRHERARAREERTRACAARREAAGQVDKAREDAIVQERLRANMERTRDWLELHRDYPIPDHLKGFVTGIDILDDADGSAAANRLINIAIIGESGTGKSSLIRELLRQFGRRSSARGADPHGRPLIKFESEGTTRPTCYAVPGFDNKVRIWDLPGQGTKGFPASSYLRDMGLKYFDGILIATDGRWKTNDAALLDAIRAAGIWFRIVRTKIDLAVESGAHDHGMSQEIALEEAKASLQAQLVNAANPRTVYLVTNRPCFWRGAHGGAPYGLVSPLCGEVIEHITSGLCAKATIADIISDQEDGFEVVD